MEKQSPIPPQTATSSDTRAPSNEVTVQHHDYPLHAEHGVLIDGYPKHDQVEEEYAQHHDLLWARIRHTLKDPIMVRLPQQHSSLRVSADRRRNSVVQ
jgi:hypothetical protein